LVGGCPPRATEAGEELRRAQPRERERLRDRLRERLRDRWDTRGWMRVLIFMLFTSFR